MPNPTNNKTQNGLSIIRVMAFHTTQNRGAYTDPIEGVLQGTSISHVAMQILMPKEAKTSELFKKYAADDKQIPHSNGVLISPSSGEQILSEYVSFWPSSQIMAPVSTTSAMLGHKHDAFISGIATPMKYDPEAIKRFGLKPIEETFAPRLPLLSYLFTYKADMPPSLIIHLSMAAGLIKQQLEAQNKSPLEIASSTIDVIKKLKVFNQKYQAWVKAYIANQNAGHLIFISNKTLKQLNDAVIRAQIALQQYTQNLKAETKDILYGEECLSDDAFTEVLEKFMSFGRNETQIIDIPVIEGLDLEAGLKYIKKLSLDPNKYQYNLLSRNCATVILEVLQEMAKNCPNKKLKACFEFPWYVKYLALPVSPAMVMQQIAKARAIIDAMHPAAHPSEVVEVAKSETESRVLELPKSQLFTAQFDNNPVTIMDQTSRKRRTCRFGF